MYEKVHVIISDPPVKDYVPYSWVSLVQVKKEHYRALANFYVALGLLDHDADVSEKTAETLQFLHDVRTDKAGDGANRPSVPRSAEERKYLGKL